MANMKEKEALQMVDYMLAKGENPSKILDLSSKAMQVVGGCEATSATSARTSWA